MLQKTDLSTPIAPPFLGTDLDTTLKASISRVLIIDDDQDSISMLKLVLRQARYDVSSVADSQTAVQKCLEVDPDLILLDVMMPERDGYALFSALRSITTVPIIFVSAASRTDNLPRALEIGAEDYVSKPFSNAELIARVQKAIRRYEKIRAENKLAFPAVGLQVDLESREVFLNSRPLSLLPREFSLLKILAENAPRNVPYGRIATMIWGQDGTRQRAHLKTIAFALRRKLEVDPEHPRLLVNNRSLGYQLITVL